MNTLPSRKREEVEKSPFQKNINQLQLLRIIFIPSLERDKIFNSLQYQPKLFA